MLSQDEVNTTLFILQELGPPHKQWRGIKWGTTILGIVGDTYQIELYAWSETSEGVVTFESRVPLPPKLPDTPAKIVDVVKRAIEQGVDEIEAQINNLCDVAHVVTAKS